jgi:hypothetical protein
VFWAALLWQTGQNCTGCRLDRIWQHSRTAAVRGRVRFQTPKCVSPEQPPVLERAVQSKCSWTDYGQWQQIHSGYVMSGADPDGCAVTGLGLQSLDCWDRGLESRWRHGCSYFIFVVCCVGSSLCDDLESYRLCVANCVWSRNFNN